jgi:acyl carrier protein
LIREEVLEGIRHVFAEYLEIDSGIEATTSFIEELPLDSLQALTLVVELENHFEVCFEEGDEKGITTVDELIDLIIHYRSLPNGGCDE